MPESDTKIPIIYKTDLTKLDREKLKNLANKVKQRVGMNNSFVARSSSLLAKKTVAHQEQD